MFIKKASGGTALAILLTILLSGCLPARPTILAPVLPTPTISTGPAAAELTQTAIVALKATDAAQMQATLTAQPTSTPTPTAPPEAVACAAGDLAGEVRAQGATGNMALSVVLTNVSNTTCLLPGPPQVSLVTPQGFPLDVDIQPFCFNCTENIDATPVPTGSAPTQTAVAGKLLHQTLSLPPAAKASVFLIWQNWCQPFPPGGIAVRLQAPGGGQLDLPSDATTGGRCDVPSARSTLLVSQYSYR